jgi:LPXTG-motif cell wall-anchored protein
VNGERYEHVTGTEADREVNMDIINEVDYVLPNTGSHATLLMSIAGMALCGMSLYLDKQEKKQEKGEKRL